MINAGVIGVSGFGATHCSDLFREHEAGRLNFAAAVIHNNEVSPQFLEKLKALKVDLFTDYPSMLAKYAGKLDICCIPTGIALHRPMTEAALASGANVFVEKPVAPTLPDAQAMEAAAKKAQRFVAVGYQTIYQPETRRIKELILSGTLGKVKRLKCYALWPRHNAYYGRNGWAGKLFNASGAPVLDSPFTNAVAHYLNLLLFYAGNTFEGTADVTSVQAHMFRVNPIESCDTADMRVLTRDGKEILFYVSHAIATREGPISLLECEKGTIAYDQEETVVRDLAGKVLDRFASANSLETRLNVWEHLRNKVTDPDGFICTVKLASKAVLVSNGVFDSAPIVDLPGSLMDIRVDDDGHIFRIIRGMDSIIRRCYLENRLITKADLAFTTDSPAFDLTKYKGFTGALCR